MKGILGGIRRGFVGMCVLWGTLVVSGCGLLPAPEPYPALEWEDLSAHDEAHRVGLLDHGWEALQVRIHLIRSARHSIELQTYIWNDDEVGRLVAYEMLHAARRGVKVRLIVDELFDGSRRAESLVAGLATAHPNLELKLYNPSADQISASWIALAAEVVTDFNGINQRAHDKLLVVDGRVAVLGGRNIANEYYDYAEGMNYKDRDVIVGGPVVGDMVASFERFWAFERAVPASELRDVHRLVCSGEHIRLETVADFEAEDVLREIDTAGPSPEDLDALIEERLRVVEEVAFGCDLPGKSSEQAPDTPTGERINPITPTLSGLMRSADESILIQTPYLVLGRRSKEMYRELRREHPDLNIRVSTNSLDSSDFWPIYSSIYRQKRSMLDELRFHIYEFKSRPGDRRRFLEGYDRLEERTGEKPTLSLHGKSMVLDDELALVGSHNLDPRSNHHNTEIMLLVRDEGFARELARSIETDLEPQNSWVVWRRQWRGGWRYAEATLDWMSGAISRVTTIDLWPSRYSSSYELRPGGRILPPGHPEFYENYHDVGMFPELSPLDEKRVLAPVFKVVVALATPLL